MPRPLVVELHRGTDRAALAGFSSEPDDTSEHLIFRCIRRSSSDRAHDGAMDEKTGTYLASERKDYTAAAVPRVRLEQRRRDVDRRDECS